MVGNKGKKQKVEEEEIDISQYADDELILSVNKLQEVQEELEKINEEVSEKVLEIEQKYDVVRKPVYDKRTDVIKSIPDFWLTAFLSHPVLGALLTEEDQLIFRYITSIEVDDLKDVKSGYSITFHFNPNPYFENSKLSKTYTSVEDRPTKITATTIKWKEGMGIPKAVPQKKNGKKRPHPQESFFTWFSEVTHKDDGDNDENEDVEFQDEVGEVIKYDLWPNPLTYFNDSDEEDSESDEEDSSESSEDEEEDGMDDDDDEDEEDK